MSSSGCARADGAVHLWRIITPTEVRQRGADDAGVGWSSTDSLHSQPPVRPCSLPETRAGLSYLRTRSEVRADRLGVLGHSEGAVIAPMVAEKEPALCAMVLLAGVAQPARGALHFQMKNRFWAFHPDVGRTNIVRISAPRPGGKVEGATVSEALGAAMLAQYQCS
jgi:pimeloyl-ACP methyl ester carboxylesterase